MIVHTPTARGQGDRATAVTAKFDGRTRGAPVQVVGLVKQFGAVRAVDGVSIDVRAGEFLALLGPSGSGKTTILMTIAGFEQPTEGDVYIDGRRVTRMPPNRREIGMVFQRYALFPHMTVWDNLAFPLKMRRVPAREVAERVEAALEMVRLHGYGARLPSQLSGGQQQRVALARAIVYRPPVLLMDEPLGALDKKLREQMQLEVKHLQRQLGATVIYVTHDQDEALTMADRIAVLSEGRLEQVGTPEELYDRPANSLVADFIGETNFLAGVLVEPEHDASTVLVEEALTLRAAPADAGSPPIPSGTPVRVAVRTERVELLRPDVGAGRGYAGTVEETVYAGSTVACIVRLGTKTTLTARVASGGGHPRWRAGDPVVVTWRAEDARIYELNGR